MPPFTVLHVCMGNICRSPMAERLLLLAVRERLSRLDVDPAGSDALVHSHSAGTGGWHAGEEMNPPAARQVTARGGEVAGFAARRLRSDLIDAADLVLTATADQQEYVVALRPDAAGRTFVLGEFGRLLGALDRSALPPAAPTPEAVHARGVALVAAAEAARQGASALTTDDLDDPWGRGDQCFSRVADEIEETVQPLAAALLP
ncbi:phosphotyrosine protein phosphatase [Micromonospora sp. WMMC241]|uniref:protein-tyrosine-phosphatase n=1 Tax=Micromonospora humi TaxID=745366 RepID=A0A1C5JT80_9ACTN|nr:MULTISPECIES: phosphotyrosine protein phosphatase [Micromonospora]MCZ7435697.1 phosphotyrosine protein phosphatase [Micromonospora sp. WMMC241]SCG73805.1 protein-tyrosine phosphatase [Micromonospora humi]